MKIDRLKELMAKCAPIPWPIDGHEHAYIAEIINALPALIAAVEALELLLQDVRDYEAWQRPCHAVDVARAALAPFEEE